MDDRDVITALDAAMDTAYRRTHGDVAAVVEAARRLPVDD